MNIGQLIASLGVDTQQLSQAQAAMSAFEKKATASITNVAKEMDKVGKSMQSFGKGMSKYVTAPLALIGVGGFKGFKDFELSMSRVEGLVGINRETVQAWMGDIKAMAPVVGKSSKELADALFYVTSAGVKGKEALDVVEMSAKAAAAGLEDTVVVADAVTSAMNAYGVANMSAERATNVLIATVREGKMAPADLAASLGKVIPLANAMGVSFEEVGASIATMTRTGFSAMESVTALRAILSGMIKPTKVAEKALRSMGTSTEELKGIMDKDGLLGALMKVKDLTNEYGEDLMAQVYPNIRALSGVLNMLGGNIEGTKAIFKAMEDNTGDLANAFAVTAKTVDFRYNQALIRAKSIMGAVGKTVSEAVIPWIEKFGETLAGVAKWFKGLNEGTQRAIIVFGGILAAIGPVVYALGSFLVLGGKILMVIPKVIATFNALKLAMLSNPITAVALAITTLIAGYIALKAAIDNANTAQKALNDVNKTVADSTLEQEANINKLIGIIQSEFTTREQQAQALRELNALAPEYLGYLTEEMVKTGQAKTAIDAYIKSLQEKARQQAISDKLAEIEKKRLETTLKYTNANSHELYKQMGVWDKMKLGFQNWNSTYISGTSIQESAAKKIAKANEEADNATKALQQAMGDVGRESGNLAMQYNALSDQMANLNSSDAAMVASTKNRISEQLAAEDKHVSALKTKLNETLKNDKQLNDQLEAFNQARVNNVNGAVLAGMAQQIQNRKEFLAQELELEYQATQERIKVLKGYAQTAGAIQIPFAPGKQPGGGTQAVTTDDTGAGGGGGGTDPITDALQNYKKELAGVTNMQKLFGDAYDASSAKLNLFRNTLETLIKEGMSPSSKTVQELQNNIKNLTLETVTSGDAMKNIAAQEAIFGDAFNETGAKIDFFKQGLKLLLENGFKPTDEAVVKLKAQFDSLKALAPVQNIFDNVTKGLALAETNALRFKDSFDKIDAQIEVYTAAIKAAEAVETPFDEESQKKLDAYREKLKQLTKEQQDQAKQKLFEQAKKDLDEAKIRADQYSDSLMYLNAQIEIYSGLINKVKSSPGVISPADQKNLAEYEKKLAQSKIDKALEETTQSLQRNSKMAGVLGDSYNVAEANVKTLASALDSLKSVEGLELASPEQLATIDALIEKLKSTGYEFEGIHDKSLFSKEGMDMLSGAMSDLNGAMSATVDSWWDFAEALVNMIPTIGQAVLGFQSLFAAKEADAMATNAQTVATEGQTVATTANTLSTNAAAVAETAKTATTEADVLATTAKTATTTANTLATTANTIATGANTTGSMANTAAKSGEAIANATASGAKLPFPANIAAIIAGVAAVIAAISMIKSLTGKKKAAKMAEGGIIPSGYPNDTYPALLTSGEMVVPQDRVKEITEVLNTANNRYQQGLPEDTVFNKTINKLYGNIQQSQKAQDAVLASNMTKGIKMPTDLPGMRMGGTVPPGYWNDSYPAMLTSGEMVVPPGKLPELKQQKVDVNVTVQGVTRGSDIHYIVKEVERRYKNSH